MIEGVGNAVDLHIAYTKVVLIAAFMILQFKGTSYFEYACSEERFHSFGAVSLLLWHAILKAKSVDCSQESLDPRLRSIDVLGLSLPDSRLKQMSQFRMG